MDIYNKGIYKNETLKAERLFKRQNIEYLKYLKESNHGLNLPVVQQMDGVAIALNII